ncbi:adenylyl-sulfate kinase [Prosthecochloris sp. N3]|uniref:Adenylyl-sulfate kinase n=1 Tax=Prosthecochloris ethylica TaxID=2743976 RepID=A0ABR9XUP2_9CHLB|nr:adenylyl-sulfate kinase [Prosthecochloris ethylica]MBF0587315.1 adenylyl-sulfate kinase [Prosthecochloris ethylica]MBF0637451.1 adenylyl-sulfate kinase [Prosthecochloris ethylica]NUK48609.1 adenylyl-sulfate kinase [Prosthecochloris ethylica]
MKHIHPVFDQILGREDKERMLEQRGCALWFTGLSGSGKTTIARHVEQALAGKGVLTQVLDGDNIRTGINNNLGFGEEDRVENIRRIAEVTKLFVHCGIVTLNCFISPTREMRQMAKDIIGADDFVEVFVDTSLEECEARDVKGLYRKARAGEIPNFTGIHEDFEAPINSDLHLKTEKKTVNHCVKEVLGFLDLRSRL